MTTLVLFCYEWQYPLIKRLIQNFKANLHLHCQISWQYPSDFNPCINTQATLLFESKFSPHSQSSAIRAEIGSDERGKENPAAAGHTSSFSPRMCIRGPRPAGALYLNLSLANTNFRAFFTARGAGRRAGPKFTEPTARKAGMPRERATPRQKH